MFRHSFLLFVLIVLFCNSTVPAMDSLRTYPKIRVHMTGVTDEFGEYGYQVIETLEKAFAEKNLVAPEKDDYATDVVVEVREINEKQIVVSVVILEPMDQDAVNLGSKAELLYAGLSEEKKNKLPLNGKAIREYASLEYLKQFRMLWNNYLEIVYKNEIEEFSKRIVQDYLSMD